MEASKLKPQEKYAYKVGTSDKGNRKIEATFLRESKGIHTETNGLKKEYSIYHFAASIGMFQMSKQDVEFYISSKDEINSPATK